MATLYEISEEILNCVDAETGEIIDQDKLSQLQMDFDDKVEGIALWIKDLLSDAAAIKAEKNKLAERQRVCENKAENLKKYLSGFLAGQKFKTARVVISYRKSKAVDVQDMAAVPEEFLKYSDPAVNKTEIKKALEAGEEVPGCILVEGQNIQIK